MSKEPFKPVLDRILAAQPAIFLQNHEGYYRHDDVSALVGVVTDAWSDMRRVAHLAENTTIHHEDALAMILAIAKGWEKRSKE
jgi:hypothetical protein